ncbi:MAG TPA: hypothetical protein PKX29_11190 [Phycicoccus sp.]|jgi:hypothetical protein|nr:hypothetical protein [Phycicoccus sp.]
MTKVWFRSDPALDAVIARLARPDESQSDTIRRALHDAETLARRERTRREAETMLDDAADRAEVRAVQSDLEALRVW